MNDGLGKRNRQYWEGQLAESEARHAAGPMSETDFLTGLPTNTERVIYAAGYRAGLEAAASVLRVWAGHYPTDIFPEDSESIDCQSAAFARHLCREIEKDIHVLAVSESSQ